MIFSRPQLHDFLDKLKDSPYTEYEIYSYEGSVRIYMLRSVLSGGIEYSIAANVFLNNYLLDNMPCNDMEIRFWSERLSKWLTGYSADGLTVDEVLLPVSVNERLSIAQNDARQTESEE
jgi:hypothetical protein